FLARTGACTLSLEFVAWSNATTRATALTTQDNVLVKSGAATRRYLGTFAPATTTTVSDTGVARNLWNYYNRVLRPITQVGPSGNWNFNNSAWGQANGGTTTTLQTMVGVLEDPIHLHVIVTVDNVDASAVNQAFVSIGEDSTTPNLTMIIPMQFLAADTS